MKHESGKNDRLERRCEPECAAWRVAMHRFKLTGTKN